MFPCHAPTATPAGCTCWRTGCPSPAKHPRVAGGLTVASTDRATIEHWWQRWPSANVAIRTGAVSGLVVLDVDPDHGGDASLEALLNRHGPLPPGGVVRTGSGGRHVYLAHPGGLVRNDTGRRLGPGLDVRGDGGYVIAPPSRHASGGRYAVAGHGGVLPDLPDWLERLLRPPERQQASPRRTWRPSGDTTAWARAALDGELKRLGEAQPGMRNHTLNKVAYRLGQIIADGRLDEVEVEGALVHGARALGLGEREALATVHSGLSAGEESPRGPAEVPVPGRRMDGVGRDCP